MTTTTRNLRSTIARQVSGSYKTADGRMVRYEARQDIRGLTFVALNVCGSPYGEVHIGEVATTLAPAITGRCGREVARQIMTALVQVVR